MSLIHVANFNYRPRHLLTGSLKSRHVPRGGWVKSRQEWVIERGKVSAGSWLLERCLLLFVCLSLHTQYLLPSHPAPFLVLMIHFLYLIQESKTQFIFILPRQEPIWLPYIIPTILVKIQQLWKEQRSILPKSFEVSSPRLVKSTPPWWASLGQW